MRAVIIVCLALLFCSCSLSKEERRMNRASKKLEKLVDKFPELQEKDTLIVPVQLHTERVVIDTLVLVADTIILNRENLRVEIIRLGDSLLVYAACDTVFLSQEIRVPVDRIQPVKTVVKKQWTIWQTVIVVFLCLVFAVFGFGIGRMTSK